MIFYLALLPCQNRLSGCLQDFFQVYDGYITLTRQASQTICHCPEKQKSQKEIFSISILAFSFWLIMATYALRKIYIF